MLDIKQIREKPEILRASQKKRGQSDAIVDQILKKDKEWRDQLQEVNNLRSNRNKVNLEIAKLKTAGKDPSPKIKEMKDVSAKITSLGEKVEKIQKERDHLLMTTPNILHESVPEGEGEEGNITLKEWGDIPKFKFAPRSHVDLLEHLDVADTERAAKTTGSRFYYLKNELVLMDHALKHMALEMLRKRGYTVFDPVLMLNRRAMEGVVDLSDFESVLYKIEGEDLYLIATSEHSLGAYHLDEILLEDDLPLKYAGVSPCFRKEAGSHGKDTKGIFRVHRFNKVEQFIFSRPEDSWKYHEELLKNAKDLVQALKIPYRIVNICTGDIGTVAAKKYDIEAWMPAQDCYREIISCSNCTEYQARRLNVRYWKAPGAETKFAHTLNSTALATGRTMVAILENFQDEGGTVTVPKVLRPFMGGIKEIKPKEKK